MNEYVNPYSNKHRVYWEATLPKPGQRIPLINHKKWVPKKYQYDIRKRQSSLDEYWQISRPNWEGNGEHMTLLKKGNALKCPIAEVIGYTKDPRAIVHSLNSTIMNHRIPDLFAIVTETNQVLLINRNPS